MLRRLGGVYNVDLRVDGRVCDACDAKGFLFSCRRCWTVCCFCALHRDRLCRRCYRPSLWWGFLPLLTLLVGVCVVLRD